MDLKEDLLTLAPGTVAIAASWLGVLDTVLSIAFITASIAFLIWRWRRAAKEKL